MNYTSIEQSKKLLELGLNPKTSDLIYVAYMFDEPPKAGDVKLPTMFEDHETKHWYYIDFLEPFYEEDWTNNKEYPNIPCWSTDALLGLLNHPYLYKDKLGDEDAWFCESYIEEFGEMFQGRASITSLDACYNVIIYLLKHNLKWKQNE